MSESEEGSMEDVGELQDQQLEDAPIASDGGTDATPEDKPETTSDGENKAKKRPSTKVIVAIVAAVVIVVAAIAYWYVSVKVPYDEAVAAYEVAAASLEERNAALDEAIEDLHDLMNSGDEPLDSTTIDDASITIGQVQAAVEDVPEMPETTDEINAMATSIDQMGDYSEQYAALEEATTNLQNSIDQYKQVTNPSEQFVIERLTGLDNITGVEAATEDNDPNGQLHKDGGYTSAVFFSSDLVDQSEVYGVDGYSGIVGNGTDGGGCVEVYETVEDAEERDAYLAAFDGTILSPGSHTVVGTCVVRTSDLLTASQQDALEQEIIESLTRLD